MLQAWSFSKGESLNSPKASILCMALNLAPSAWGSQYSANADNPGSRSWRVVERILVGLNIFDNSLLCSFCTHIEEAEKWEGIGEDLCVLNLVKTHTHTQCYSFLLPTREFGDIFLFIFVVVSYSKHKRVHW